MKNKLWKLLLKVMGCVRGKRAKQRRQVAIENEENKENVQHLLCWKHNCMVCEKNDEQEIEHDDLSELCLSQG